MKNQATHNPKLKTRKMRGGMSSLYLQYHHGTTRTPLLDKNGNQVYYTKGASKGRPKFEYTHHRESRTLEGLTIYTNPRTAKERAHNTEVMQIAENLRWEAQQRLTEEKHGKGKRLQKRGSVDFYKLIKTYIKNSQNTEGTLIKYHSALKKLYLFTEQTPQFKMYAKVLPTDKITKNMGREYAGFLKNCLSAGTANGYLTVIKKIARFAVEQGYADSNPFEGLIIHGDTKQLKKPVLTEDEIRLLHKTHYPKEDEQTRRAFIFCCFTGMSNIDLENFTYN